MSYKVFSPNDFNLLYKPPVDVGGDGNGILTVVGGSELFHGASLLSVSVASRFVGTVFFSSPYEPMHEVADKLKASLMSFIWVPWSEVNDYISKSNVCLVGPGFMRYRSEGHEPKNGFDSAGDLTRTTTLSLLASNPSVSWVVDAGSLQVLKPEELPKGSIVTPNKEEFERLFGVDVGELGGDLEALCGMVLDFSNKYGVCLVLKGPETIVAFDGVVCVVEGGSPGLAKGGTGDIQSGLTAALFCKNDAFISSCWASYVVKKSAEDLSLVAGVNFNADNLVDQIPKTFNKLTSLR